MITSKNGNQNQAFEDRFLGLKSFFFTSMIDDQRCEQKAKPFEIFLCKYTGVTTTVLNQSEIMEGQLIINQVLIGINLSIYSLL